MLVRDNHFIDTPKRPGYHLTEDLADTTISLIRDQQQCNTGRPFFAYLALGACHAPFHAPTEFIAKYKGKFDQGWDVVHEQTLERQKQLGILPEHAELTERDPLVPAWDELDNLQKKVYCRLQEAFAGFLAHADHHIGRVLDSLDQLGIRDDTIVILTSDNGASQEGLRHGVTNTDRYRNFNPETVKEMSKVLDKIGGPESDALYPMGWALAGNAPFKKWKQDTHFGGNTDTLIISWPPTISDVGAIRNQYHHLIDLVPTVLEVTGVPEPTSVNGIEQIPVQGTSLAYTFTKPAAKTRKRVQYYEMLGSRAIWSGGWTAVAWHKKDTSWADDKWELYHTDVDVTQVNDLAAKRPDKLQQMIATWQAEAEKFQVLPLDDRRYERAADPGRPIAALTKDRYTFYAGTSNLHPLAGPQMLGKEHLITATVKIPRGGAEGVLASFGGKFGGWTLFVKDRRLHYVHNYLKIQEYEVVSTRSVSAGQHSLGVRFMPTGKNLKPDFFTGDVTLFIDGKQAGQINDVKTGAMYSAMTGYGLVIGRNTGTEVCSAYDPPFAFTGQIDRVTIDLTDNEGVDHEAAIRIAMAQD